MVFCDNIAIREMRASRSWCSDPSAGDRVSNSAAIPLPIAFYDDKFRCRRRGQIRLVPLMYNEFWAILRAFRELKQVFSLLPGKAEGGSGPFGLTNDSLFDAPLREETDAESSS
jgi:hypothetical protein